MNELRLVLIALGAALIAALLGWELLRRRRAGSRGAGAAAAGLAAGVSARLRAGITRIRALRAARGAPDPVRKREPSLGSLGGDGSGTGAGEIDLGDLGALAGGRDPAGEGPSSAGRGAASEPAPGPEREPVPGPEPLLVALTLFAPPKAPLHGAAVKQALEMFGLRHGHMGLFHHHAGLDPDAAPVVFSVADVLEPGTFDPARMAELRTPGVCLFLQLPGPLEGVVAFDLMLDIATKLARELGAEVRDVHRSTLTGQGAAALRERIVEFEGRAAGRGQERRR